VAQEHGVARGTTVQRGGGGGVSIDITYYLVWPGTWRSTWHHCAAGGVNIDITC
jgi:hypothetical protein